MKITGSSIRIVNNTFYSFGFPEKDWVNLIERDNYITQIESLLSDKKIIFLEGEEDSGKTTLCSQFCRKHSFDAISVFFNPLSIIDYTVEHFISNVISQIKNILNQIPDKFEHNSFYSIAEYRQNIFQLRRIKKGSHAKIFLVIDGLENILSLENDFVQRLLEIIPFGDDLFRIVISGNQKDFLELYPKLKKEEAKSISLLGFSRDEII